MQHQTVYVFLALVAAASALPVEKDLTLDLDEVPNTASTLEDATDAQYKGQGPCYGPASRITIVTGFAIDSSDSATKVLAHRRWQWIKNNRIEYAQKHGYRTCLYEHTRPGPVDLSDYDPEWARVNWLLASMQPTRSWMFWLDADAIFNPVQFDQKLDEIVSKLEKTDQNRVAPGSSEPIQKGPIHLFLTDETVGGVDPTNFRQPDTQHADINDGAFFIDSSKFSRSFLAAIPFDKNKARAPLWEQDAMWWWRKNNQAEWKANARLVPHNLFNTRSGCGVVRNRRAAQLSFVLHWAGCGGGLPFIRLLKAHKYYDIEAYLKRFAPKAHHR